MISGPPPTLTTYDAPMLKQNAIIPVIVPKTIAKLKNIMPNIYNQPHDIL